MFQIDNTYQGANTPRTIRFTKGMFETLNQVAQEIGISFNMLVLQCCQYALDNLERSEEERPNA